MSCVAFGVGGMLRRAGDNIITHRRRCSRIGDDVEEVLLLIECDLVGSFICFFVCEIRLRSFQCSWLGTSCRH